MNPKSSTAAPHTNTAGTSPIGCVRTSAGAATGAAVTGPSFASPGAAASRRPGAAVLDGSARVGPARGVTAVGRTCRSVHDADAPALHPSVAHPAIVPPYLLARIATTDDPQYAAAADAARRSLVRDAPLREFRAEGELPSFMAHEHRRARRASCRRAEHRPQPDRRISDAEGDDKLPGRLVRREGRPPTGDPAVDQAYDGLGDTFEMFARVFARDSIDDAGMPLEATVHYGDRYDNAFWDGERMVFGDGDGEVFRGFTDSISVIGHELAHGVTERAARLRYEGQSGALNEHDLRRVRRARRAVRHGPGCRVGRLAHRRGRVRRRRSRARAIRSMIEPAPPTTTTSSARTRSPTTSTATSTPTRTTAACTSTRASPTGRSRSPRSSSAGSHGSTRAGSGTTCSRRAG